MRLYLDDDLAGPLLAQLLRKAGHDVRLPVEVGLTGKQDAEHLQFAVREDRVCLSRNYQDFEVLHNLILEAKGHHPGILIVRRDNDPKRNLKPRDIVSAIAKLMAAGVRTLDQYLILNHWR